MRSQCSVCKFSAVINLVALISSTSLGAETPAEVPLISTLISETMLTSHWVSEESPMSLSLPALCNEAIWSVHHFWSAPVQILGQVSRSSMSSWSKIPRRGRRMSVRCTCSLLPRSSPLPCPPTLAGAGPLTERCAGPPAWRAPGGAASAQSSAAGGCDPGTRYLEALNGTSCPPLEFRNLTVSRLKEITVTFSSAVYTVVISPLRSGSLLLKVNGMTRKLTLATRCHCFSSWTVHLPGRRGCCSGGL